MPNINIVVRKKVATNVDDTEYICGNSDFLIDFDFDAEWDAFDFKTARFISGSTYKDVVFQGKQCKMPVHANTNTILCGVFAGDLHTTTPAVVKSRKSILCGTGSPAAPEDDVYAQMMELLNKCRVPDYSAEDEGKFLGIKDGSMNWTKSGGISFETDETLSMKDGVLSVNTAKAVEKDNTLPITSAAVHTEVGNIEVLLAAL